jgi:apolipoprotein D and lipocalin family protein
MRPATWLAALCLGLCALTVSAQTPAPLGTVASVDVPRYIGTWYEIAKYPNWFQKKCASSTSAQYSLQADGQVQVLNRCKTANGEWSEALGMARQIGRANSPRLQVRLRPHGCRSSPWSGAITGSSTWTRNTSGW